MRNSIRLLMIEDSEDDSALLVLLLRQAGYELQSELVDSAANLAKALNNNWDIIISDHSMPHFSGTEALKMVRAQDPDVPFIFVSGTIGEDVATDAMRNGAQDYVMKTNLKRLDSRGRARVARFGGAPREEKVGPSSGAATEI